MSQQPRRRLRSAPAPRRVGEPNVLSNQAIPNTLSTSTTAAKSGAPAAPSRQQARSVTTSPSSGAARQADPRFERPARGTVRLPSFGTVLFILFLLYTVVRILTQ